MPTEGEWINQPHGIEKTEGGETLCSCTPPAFVVMESTNDLQPPHRWRRLLTDRLSRHPAVKSSKSQLPAITKATGPLVHGVKKISSTGRIGVKKPIDSTVVIPPADVNDFYTTKAKISATDWIIPELMLAEGKDTVTQHRRTIECWWFTIGSQLATYCGVNDKSKNLGLWKTVLSGHLRLQKGLLLFAYWPVSLKILNLKCIIDHSRTYKRTTFAST